MNDSRRLHHFQWMASNPDARSRTLGGHLGKILRNISHHRRAVVTSSPITRSWFHWSTQWIPRTGTRSRIPGKGKNSGFRIPGRRFWPRDWAIGRIGVTAIYHLCYFIVSFCFSLSANWLAEVAVCIFFYEQKVIVSNTWSTQVKEAQFLYN